MKTKDKNSKDSIREKFSKGSKLAIKKLIEERKKNDDYLVVSRNGKVVKIKARELK
ncbi:MAG: hypothetical protein J0M37_06715 [Ignavibacteria bacterium]|nr:hypothetical protein [Ignavibacteria bacterium]